MISIDTVFVSLLVALGIGLLIGTERERRKGQGPQRAAAGLRTFAIASLAGFVGMKAGGAITLSVVTVAASALMALAYWVSRERDPGLTTELALILTVVLGGLAVIDPALAAAAGVTVAILLAARSWLHRFVSTLLTESELRDGLILAAATFIVLPILPDRPVDPFGAINPRSVWTVAVLVMAIGALGHIAVRIFGPRFGLPAAGLASGFISSTATIAAMGGRARADATLAVPATIGAILSTVATVVQMAFIVAVTSIATLQELAPALLLAGGASVVYAIGFGLQRDHRASAPSAETSTGRAFSLRAALFFAALLAVVLLATTIVGDHFGTPGLAITTALAGFVDTHSPAIAIATLVDTGQISAPDSVLPILLAFTSNSVSKMVFAVVSGGTAFAARVIPGLVLVVACLWLGATMF